VRLGTEDVLSYGAEYVVIATGAFWATNGLNYVTHEQIPGADASLPHVLVPEQLAVDGKRPRGNRVVIYDTDGYYMAPVLAEKLVQEGYGVEIITSFALGSPFSDLTMEGNLTRERLAALGVRWHVSTVLESCSSDGVTVKGDFGQRTEIAADGIVLVTHRLSRDDLYHSLTTESRRFAECGIIGAYRIGDCVAPRTFADAVFDGHRLAREIDSRDPAIPLPVLRDGLVSNVTQ
jgi:dimethylamine/trimethylamine dehydrogenase